MCKIQVVYSPHTKLNQIHKNPIHLNATVNLRIDMLYFSHIWIEDWPLGGTYSWVTNNHYIQVWYALVLAVLYGEPDVEE